MTDTDNEYITIDNAARMLGKSQRTVYRYAEQGRLTTHDTPNGKLFERVQVDALAAELHITPQPVQPTTELVPVSDMLAELHRKDDALAEAHERLQRAALEVGRLQGQIEAQQKALTDLDMARQRIIELERQNAQLRAELEVAKTPAQPTLPETEQPAEQLTKHVPWWKRLFEM